MSDTPENTSLLFSSSIASACYMSSCFSVLKTVLGFGLWSFNRTLAYVFFPIYCKVIHS